MSILFILRPRSSFKPWLALLDSDILDSVEPAAGILEFSLLWMLGRNPKQGWQLNLGEDCPIGKGTFRSF